MSWSSRSSAPTASARTSASRSAFADGRWESWALIDRQRHSFDAEELALFTSAGEQLGVAIERARLFEQSRQRVKLEERARLAREIHDSLAQALTGIVIQLEDAEDVVASRPERARAEIHSACALARQSLEEARRSVWELQPLALASGGITAAIGRELQALRAEGLDTTLDAPAEAPEALDERTQLIVYRIAQEALNNVRCHARATQATVGMTLSPSAVRLVVSDDGIGFDPAGTEGPTVPRPGPARTDQHAGARAPRRRPAHGSQCAWRRD
jgi:signal transduction histidine kinase